MMNRILLFFLMFIIFLLALFFLIKKNVYYNFSKIPILFDGKIRSFDSFSKSFVNEFYLSCYYKSHIEITSSILFNFSNFAKFKVFEIKNKDLVRNLNLKECCDNLYSFNDVFAVVTLSQNLVNSLIKVDYDNRTVDQNLFLKLYFSIYNILNLKKYFLDFINLRNNSNIDLSSNFDKKNDEYFYFIPLAENDWVSPSVFFLKSSLEKKDLLDIINNIYSSFSHDNLFSWSENCELFYNKSFNVIPSYYYFKIIVELLYNKFNLIFYSFLFYCASFIFFIFFKIFKFKSLFLGLLLMFLGFFFHIFELFFRIFIAERPPITNLYESIIFVNLCIFIFFLYFYFKFKFNKFFFVFFSILQYLAYKYSIDGTNIKNLLPVLNTNFWLILHVVTITLGYSFCLFSSFLAHFYLYYSLDSYKNKKILYKISSYIYLFVILALLFVFCGTILGGVWADQSWGRFWGWDPKENGAMLIALWLTLILHLKLLKSFDFFYFMNSVLFSNVVVFFSWFGVNLLNVGLHSYGFTYNIGFWLIVLFLFEISYILYFYLRIRLKFNFF